MSNLAPFEAAVQARPAGRIALYRKMNLRVGDTEVVLERNGISLFRCLAANVTVTASGINGTVTIRGGSDAFVVKFYEQSHPFRSRTWHVQMMRKKHNDFVDSIRASGCKTVPPEI